MEPHDSGFLQPDDFSLGNEPLACNGEHMRIDSLVARSRVRDLLLQCPRIRDAMPREYSDETTTRQGLPFQASPLHIQAPSMIYIYPAV